MQRFHALMEAVGQALAEKARRALTGQVSFGDVLPDVAKYALDYMHRHLPAHDIRPALGFVASLPPDEYRKGVVQMIDKLAKVQSVPFRVELADYLSHFPLYVRKMFRRPSDPSGKTPPEKLDFYKPEQLLIFLPPRRPRFQAGDHPPGLDHWTLTELRGLGECSEVWLGTDADEPDQPPVVLKFATDPETAARLKANTAHFEQAFGLNEINGVAPLRQVFLETDPPCLESDYVSGYDLSGLMNEWKWRYPTAKPDAALRIMRRVCEIVAQAHAKGVVHRDLKPSNVRVHPTEGGKFTLWVTDFGWGQIESVRSVELARGGTPKGEQTRLAYRGAYTPLYASPQQQKREPADPRDDVHALGVIWFQLLKRDPHAAAPVGTDWADEFIPHGFTTGMARTLSACVATRPDKRPNTAGELFEQLRHETVTVSVHKEKALDDGSKLMPLVSQAGASSKAVVTARGKVVADDAASRAAAGLLGAVGGGLPGGGPIARFQPAAATDTPTPLGTRVDGRPALVRNSLGMAFALVPAGTFEMGAGQDEHGHKPHETPRHTVRITRPFYLGVYPVTQGQFEKLMREKPSFFQKHGGGADLPVESVLWADAERFCRKLSALTDESVAGRAYRLPTEAEWEFACRAGTATAYSCGDRLTEKDAHHKEKIGTGQGQPDPVGRHPANPLGLHDAHGNVSEWVSDWYDEYYYFDSPGTDPKGPPAGTLKVARGGSWADPAVDCRSAARKAQHPERPCNTIGFRVLMVPPG